MQDPYPPLEDSEFMDFKCPDCGSPVSFPKPETGSIKECPTCLEALIVPPPGVTVGEKIPMPIPTSRLIIRRLQTEDWKDITEIVSSEDTLCFLTWEPMEVEQVEQWLATDKNVRFPQKDRDVCFAIEHAQTNKVIGLAPVWYSSDHPNQAHFFIIIHPDYQHQGYGLEAAKGLLNFGFHGLRLHRITAECDSRDPAGQALLKKAALRQEGEFIKDQQVKGTWVNTLSFAILKEEFQ